MPFPASHPALDRALSERGYDEPTPVQAAVLEAEAGRDLLVSAQTGSGKTVAFGLALADSLLAETANVPLVERPLALIVAPTRDFSFSIETCSATAMKRARRSSRTSAGSMPGRSLAAAPSTGE